MLVLHHHQRAGAEAASAYPDDVEKIIRANRKQGLFRYFITDDNFARNKDWKSILDRLIDLREVEKMDISFLIQVDTFVRSRRTSSSKCARAGVKKVLIGLENINPANLMAAKKQNKITEYRPMLLAWQKAGILCYAGYITGFPADTAELVLHDIDVLKRELPIDALEIFYLTPLPGSEDHQELFRAGAGLDPDLNKYDVFHITANHPKMTRAEWEYAYHEAWRRYYSYEHCETVMRRAARCARSAATLTIGDLVQGLPRDRERAPAGRRHRPHEVARDRRTTMPMEPVWRFYRATGRIDRQGGALGLDDARLRKIYLSIKHDPKRYEYVDAANEPVTEDEVETQTTCSRARQRRPMSARSSASPAIRKKQVAEKQVA